MSWPDRYYHCKVCGETSTDEICCQPPIVATPLSIEQADQLRRGLPDFTPRLMDLQARVQTLDHVLFLSSLAFQLITEHPENAVAVAREALARLKKETRS